MARYGDEAARLQRVGQLHGEGERLDHQEEGHDDQRGSLQLLQGLQVQEVPGGERGRV